MNYLARLFLSGTDPEFRTRNFTGDHVKARNQGLLNNNIHIFKGNFEGKWKKLVHGKLNKLLNNLNPKVKIN